MHQTTRPGPPPPMNSLLLLFLEQGLTSIRLQRNAAQRAKREGEVKELCGAGPSYGLHHSSIHNDILRDHVTTPCSAIIAPRD